MGSREGLSRPIKTLYTKRDKGLKGYSNSNSTGFTVDRIITWYITDSNEGPKSRGEERSQGT